LVRVRFADLRSVTRSVTLDIPISATAILAEIAEALVRGVRLDHSHEKFISLLATAVSHLEACRDLQLELPLALPEERRRPGTKRGLARWSADLTIDSIRNRRGGDAVGYRPAALGPSRTVRDAFRELAEKEL
jgi:DNA polymerase-4